MLLAALKQWAWELGTEHFAFSIHHKCRSSNNLRSNKTQDPVIPEPNRIFTGNKGLLLLLL